MVKIADRILFYLILKPLSYLPLGILYFYSSIVGFLTYYVVRYRRAVVRNNLTKAFPDKSISEIKKIEKDFYKRFVDFIFESIKAVSISNKALLKRTHIKNPEYIDQLYKQGKNIIVTCGHINNWEFYALSLPQQVPYKTFSVYQPLKNRFYDRIIYKSRTRNGMQLIETKQLIPFFKEEVDEKRMVVIVNDQSPSNKELAHWNTFLNQETGWSTGPEKLAKKFNYAVVFGYAKRVKRGYYEVEFSEVCIEPQEVEDGVIIDRYTKQLEALIHKTPASWLWSHKRWKHQRPSSK
ncbi:lysophospholipid acyltransferase family protein [Paracrocinitomix mangrovi]|uniref:lysophospholipid acyltransferase family protein n=1 Tax=Paracrocinitomix mangrovi TaxID=2862509 RepID=UPI001C8F1643|nr:lysophospholipid acyltransferase family protein [Paracrocinitomix mangrovi]UKN02159.1 lysophospholipid acyltransferase family protein [Paracrocinitomix mangrovi]